MQTVYSTDNRAGRRKLGRRMGVVVRVAPDKSEAEVPLDKRPCGWCILAGRGPILMGLHPKNPDGRYDGHHPIAVIEGRGLVLGAMG